MPIFPISPATPLGAPAPGKYHMWWRRDDDAPFSTGATRGYIGRAFGAASGNEVQVWKALFAPRVVPTGPDGVTVQVSPTNARAFVLTFNPEKGVRVHFDPASTTAAERDAIWLELATFAEGSRTELSRSLWFRLRERFASASAEEWWRTTEQVLVTLEASGEPPQAVGTISIGVPN